MANNNYANAKQYSGQTAPAKNGNVATLGQLLTKNLDSIRSALPKHLTPERIARVAINFISKTPQLQNCSAASLCGAIMEASSLGLEIDMRGLAYLVPYGQTAQLIIGYKGLIDLALRSGKVRQIYADVIGENDTYDIIMGLEPQLIHKPNILGRGPVIGSYAVAVLMDGSKQFVVVTRDDLDKVQKASKSGNSGPWVQWYEQMAMKTAVKRLCKFLALSPEVQRATAIDDEANAGVVQTFETTIDVPGVVSEQKPQEEVQDVKSNYEFTCPKNEKRITEETCKECKERPGCPQWEAV